MPDCVGDHAKTCQILTPPYMSGNFPRGFATTVEHFSHLAPMITYGRFLNIRGHTHGGYRKEEDPGQVEEFFSDIQDAAIGGYVHSLGTIDTTEGEGVNQSGNMQVQRSAGLRLLCCE